MSSSDRIPLEGVLNCWNDDHDLPDLLLFVCRTKKTGRLAFSNPEGDKTLHVRNGKIVFAESSSGDDGLGHYLLRTGRISLVDYLRVSKLVEPGKRLGALLVAEGVMEPKDLAPAVLGQVRSIILGLFRRTETWYRFKEEALSSETITLDLPVESLILDGVRQVESWRRISKGVGQLESQYRSVEEKQAEWEGASFPPVVEEIFEMLRKPISVAEICTQATLPDFEACRYIWAFRSLGWVEPLDEKPKTVEASASASASDAADAHASQTPARDVPTWPNFNQRSPLAPPLPADPKPDSKFRQPTNIPQQLIQTQIAIDPPKRKRETSTGNTQRITPAPVIPDLEQTNLSVEAPDSPPSPEPPPDPPTEKTERVAPKPPPIPADLARTNLAIEPPSARAKRERETGTETKTPETTGTPPPVPAVPPAPKPISEELAQTNLTVEPPKAPVTSAEDGDGDHVGSSPPVAPSVPLAPTPRPIPDELAQTNLAVEPPSTKSTSTSADAEREPVTAAAADFAAESETETETETETDSESGAMAPSMADIATGGLAQTQLFIEPPRKADPSTGEMMESILSGESSPDVFARSRAHSPIVSDPDLDTGENESLVESESETDDGVEARRDRALESDRHGAGESNAATTGPAGPAEDEPRKEELESEDAPAGFEALALDDSDPSIGSIQSLSMPGHLSSPELNDPEPARVSPEPTPVGTSSSFEEEDAMASFGDLAYAPEPSSATPAPVPAPEPEAEAEPVVEGTVVSEPVPVFEAEPEGPAPEPPILAPPPPPRRKRGPDDDFDLDRDGFTHLITRNND